jgi:hypothetical protein
MSLQKKTLQRYRQHFPQDTLKEVSARTGIQITRVFRLFNGKPMKVGELEAFESAVNLKLAQNPEARRFQDMMERMGATLGEQEMRKIMLYTERKLLNREQAHLFNQHQTESAIIA